MSLALPQASQVREISPKRSSREAHAGTAQLRKGVGVYVSGPRDGERFRSDDTSFQVQCWFTIGWTSALTPAGRTSRVDEALPFFAVLHLICL